MNHEIKNELDGETIVNLIKIQNHGMEARTKKKKRRAQIKMDGPIQVTKDLKKLGIKNRKIPNF